MARSIEIAPNEFYHLYNRGVDKRRIFHIDGDYRRFLALLYLANQDGPTDLKYQGRSFSEITERDNSPLVAITAYCLMPNHFHLLVREKIDGGISKFMQKLTTGYTMYFNKRNERSGALFQGTYKAQHVNDDIYLRYLISYIHLNPIKIIEPKWKETGIENRKGARHYLEQYRYSSYLDFLDRKRPEEKILEKEALPEYFESAGDFETCVTEWLTYSTNRDKV